MKGSCVSVCACSVRGCVSSCVIVISVDPVIKCSGPEGLPDIKALNDAIYYVRCVDVCVSVSWGFLLLPSLMFLLVGVELVVYCCCDRYKKHRGLSTTTRKESGAFNVVGHVCRPPDTNSYFTLFNIIFLASISLF